MKRKAKKAAIGRKERHLTPAELKKISAGIAAVVKLHPEMGGGFDGGMVRGDWTNWRDINR